MLIHAHRVLFSTADEEHKVLHFLNIQVSSAILPNILDLTPFENLPERGAFRKEYGIEGPMLVHFGRISLKKGIRFVLEAIPELTEKYPNLMYVIAGGDEEGYARVLHEIVNELGISKHVLFTGLLTQGQGISLLRDADVFVLPSLSENFGMSVVEAMLCETPVIVSDQVGIASELATAGCAVVTSNELSVKDAVLSLLQTESKRKELGLLGARFAKTHYSFEVLREKMQYFLSI